MKTTSSHTIIAKALKIELPDEAPGLLIVGAHEKYGTAGLNIKGRRSMKN